MEHMKLWVRCGRKCFEKQFLNPTSQSAKELPHCVCWRTRFAIKAFWTRRFLCFPSVMGSIRKAFKITNTNTKKLIHFQQASSAFCYWRCLRFCRTSTPLFARQLADVGDISSMFRGLPHEFSKFQNSWEEWNWSGKIQYILQNNRGMLLDLRSQKIRKRICAVNGDHMRRGREKLSCRTSKTLKHFETLPSPPPVASRLTSH